MTLTRASSSPSATASRGGLGRAGGVAAGLSSVVGAGLVGLPAALLVETRDAAVVTWLVAVALCLPMIVLFRDTVRHSPGSSDPLRTTVAAGLGRRWGDTVPLMFGMVVVVGLPVNAVVGARSLVVATGVDVPETALVAAILATAVVTNLVGATAGARVQQVGVVVLGVVLVGLVGWAAVHAPEPVDVIPSTATLPAVPAGVLLAFWAFVGFENLTFLARDLRSPRRDFLPVALITLALLTTLAVGLTVAVALSTPTTEVDPVTGVVDAAARLPLGRGVALVVAAGVAVAILLNALAWVRGVALVLRAAAAERLLPGWFAGTDPAVPHRTILLLTAGFTVTVSVLHRWPDLVVDLLAAASAVFVVIYAVCIVAYARARGPRGWALANLALLPILLWSLVDSGPRALYAVVVLGVALAVTRWRRSGSAPADLGVAAPDLVEDAVGVVDRARGGAVPHGEVEPDGRAGDGRAELLPVASRGDGTVLGDLDRPGPVGGAERDVERAHPCEA